MTLNIFAAFGGTLGLMVLIEIIFWVFVGKGFLTWLKKGENDV